VSVIRNVSQLSEADRAAIANYVKSLPPVDGPPKPKKADKKADKE
jgi:mono/diheme cytochrome c family protein